MIRNRLSMPAVAMLIFAGVGSMLSSGCAASHSSMRAGPEPQRLVPAANDTQTVILAHAGMVGAGDRAEWRIYGPYAPQPDSSSDVAFAAAETAIDTEPGRPSVRIDQLKLKLPDDAVLDPRMLSSLLRSEGYCGTLLVVGVLTTDAYGVGYSAGNVQVGVEAWNIESCQQQFAKRKDEQKRTPILWVSNAAKSNGQPSDWARTTICRFIGELVPAALARG